MVWSFGMPSSGFASRTAMRKAHSVRTVTSSLRPRLFVAVTLTALAVLIPSFAAQAQTSLRAQNGAGVLQRYLAANGNHFNFPGSDYVDVGLTLDSVVAMDASGVGDYRSEKVTQWVADNLDGYTFDNTGTYSGATAKALVVSLSQNVTPMGTLGGRDLLQDLTAMEQPDGQFVGTGQYEFSSAIGQSLALVALHKVGRTLSYDSIAFLRQQQCADGGFRLQTGATCESDPDATSFAVQGLLAAPQTDVTKRRITWAINYLKSKMAANGGVKGGSSTAAPNANSTGLAVMAFDTTGNATLAAKGRSFLVSLRYGCAFPAEMRGAVAYNSEARAQAKAKGSAARLTDQDLRSTTQAVLGFTQTPLKDVTNTGARFSSPTVRC